MIKRNLQNELDSITKHNEALGIYPTLLLHVCCAPCSSYCLEYLSKFFDITVYFYNPNIDDKVEYIKRRDEEIRLIKEMKTIRPVKFLEGTYEPDEFHKLVKGHEHDPERGERCHICYEMRLAKAAQVAAEGGYDYITTTLSISPLKDAGVLYEIGERIVSEYNGTPKYLPSDFKKREGYKRSIELSQIYGLYRQNYCGCSYSKAAMEESVNNKHHEEVV